MVSLHMTETSAKETQQGFLKWAWDWIKAIGIAVILAFVIRAFLFEPVVVKGESMMPTLEDRERLIMNKFVYLIGEPKRNDVIVFHATEQEDYIKRVIAYEGDTVEMSNDQLMINGKPVEEPYLKQYRENAEKEGSLPLTYDFGPITIPQDNIFVMGDNRQNSKDSRDPSVGPVPLDKVVGRAHFVFWPFGEFRSLK